MPVRYLMVPAVLALGLAPMAEGQVATKLIAEGDAVSYQDGTGATVNTTVDVLRFSGAANTIGGFVVQFDTADDASHIFGSTNGVSPLDIIRTAGEIGSIQQTQFDGELGLADDGTIAYVATFDDGLSLGVKGVFLNDTALIRGDTATPDNFLDTRITPNGTPSTLTLAPPAPAPGLFVGNPAANTVGNGDSVTVAGGGSFNIDGFLATQHGFSDVSGSLITAFIDTGSTADDGIILLNGAPIASGAGNIREGDASNGGVGNWDNFDFLDINDSGTTLITGDTDGSSALDEFIAINGQVVVKEEDFINGGQVDGGIESAMLNNNDDWVAIWDVVGGDEAIILGSGTDTPTVLLQEGDTVDVDGSLVELTDLTVGLVITDRRVDGTFDVYFQGRAGDSNDVQFVITIPEPSSLALIAIGGLALARRRRSSN